MAQLTAAQLETLEGKLNQERDRLQGILGERDEIGAGGDPGDRQDLAAEHADRTQTSMLLRRTQDRLHEVLAALGRIAAGTYGLCEESDEPIPFARLLLDPVTRHTVEIQEELEEEAARRRADANDDEAY